MTLHRFLKQLVAIMNHIWFLFIHIPWLIIVSINYRFRKHYQHVTFYTDIYHKQKSVNLYIPNNRDMNQILIFVHGGGWNSGMPLFYHNLGITLAKELNMPIAIVQYTLYPAGNINDMIHDVSMSIQWCKISSNRYGLNVEHVHLFGHSAGAHIICLTLLNRIRSNYAWDLSDIKSFTAVSGIYDIVQHFETETSRAVERFSGMAGSMLFTNDNFIKYSPTYIIRDALIQSDIREKFPPTLLVDTENDTTVIGSLQTSVFFKYMKEQIKHEHTRYMMLKKFNHSDPVTCLIYYNNDQSKMMINCLSSSINFKYDCY